jgi:hypothetical protein
MFLYYTKKTWHKYLLPHWMNSVTYEAGADMKVYRWLIFGWTTK